MENERYLKWKVEGTQLSREQKDALSDSISSGMSAAYEIQANMNNPFYRAAEWSYGKWQDTVDYFSNLKDILFGRRLK